MTHEVLNKVDSYPIEISLLLFQLRDIILDVIKELRLGDVEESLKWGEPSYNVSGGSAVRFDWKSKTPSEYFLFFNCKTKLVETFRELYGDALVFQGNRGIVLSVENKLPEKIIRQCIVLALTYKSVKDLPLLGQAN